MKPQKLNLLLTPILIAACCGIASSQTIKIVETLPEDSFIVQIGDKEYRAISAEKVRELQKLRIDFAAATKTNSELQIQIKAALLQRDLANAQKDLIQQKADSFKADFERSQEDAKRNFGLFISERTLRQEASQFIPKGNAHGFWGKTLDFLNSQQAQVGFKLIVPTATFLRAYTARCPP